MEPVARWLEPTPRLLPSTADELLPAPPGNRVCACVFADATANGSLRRLRKSRRTATWIDRSAWPGRGSRSQRSRKEPICALRAQVHSETWHGWLNRFTANAECLRILPWPTLRRARSGSVRAVQRSLHVAPPSNLVPVTARACSVSASRQRNPASPVRAPPRRRCSTPYPRRQTKKCPRYRTVYVLHNQKYKTDDRIRGEF